VTDEPVRRTSLARAVEHVLFGVGAGIAGTVYGTVVVMATLAAAWAGEKDPWKLALIVSSTSLVLWIAHLYAHGLSESIVKNTRLDAPELRAILQREVGVLLAALGPCLVLVLGSLGVFDENTAVWLALGVGLVTLAGEGVRFARLEHLGPTGTLVATGLNLGLGLLVVALKVALAH
jgi:hypothetical protein